MDAMIFKIYNKIKSIKNCFFSNFRFFFASLYIKIFKKPYVFTDRFGLKFYQDTYDPLQKNFFRNTIGDSIGVVNYILKNIKQGSVCIDIGASNGLVSVACWSKAGSLSGKVYSIEADYTNIEKLKSNLILNGFPVNFIDNIGISNNDSKLKFKRFIGHNGWQTFGNPSFVEGIPYEIFDVNCVSFKTFFLDKKLNKIDLIKIDVEGAEWLVLDGMREYLELEIIKSVIFEVNYLMLEGFGKSVHELFLLWKDLNYELFMINDQGLLEQLHENKFWPDFYIGDCLAKLKLDHFFENE